MTNRENNEFWRRIDAAGEEQKRREAEFQRLCAEPCMVPVAPGDRVVVAVGFLGMGYLWVRRGGVALHVGGGSVLVKLDDDEIGSKPPMWIHPALIVDVFPPDKE